jgi:hypothetical protein
LSRRRSSSSSAALSLDMDFPNLALGGTDAQASR